MSDNENEVSTTVDGVRAVELYYQSVKRISTGVSAFYQSQMRLNSPLLGTMLPTDYSVVAECSDQCVDLFRLGFLQLLRTLKNLEDKGTSPQFVSLYMPIRALLAQNCAQELMGACSKFEIDTDKICFELSSDLLFETDGSAATVIAALSSEGFRFMLNDFGAAGCPIVGIAPFPMDFVILDKALCYAAGKGERENACVKAMTSLASQLGAEIIAHSVDNKEREKLFSDLGCIYTVSGDYMSPRYAFRKKSSK